MFLIKGHLFFYAENHRAGSGNGNAGKSAGCPSDTDTRQKKGHR